MLWHPGSTSSEPPRAAVPGLSDRRPAVTWALSAAILSVLVLLTLALWRAELRIDGHPSSRSPMYVLWGGLVICLLMTIGVFQTLHHRLKGQEQTQRYLEAIESLNGISVAIGAQMGSGKALDELAEAARKLLAMDRAGVCLVDLPAGTIEVIAAAGDMPEQFPTRFQLSQLPACRYCVETRTLLFESDIRQVRRPYSLETVRTFGVVAMILIPLQLEGQPIGLLTLSSSHPREFSNLHRRIAELLGSQAAVILSNAQLYEKTRSALEEQTRLLQQRRALSAANAAVVASGTLEDSLRQMIRLVPGALGAELCALVLVTGEPAEATMVAVTAPYEHLTGTCSGPSELMTEAFRTGGPLVVADAPNEPRLQASWKDIPHIGSILFLPMFRGNRQPLGLLALARRQKGAFSQDQLELAQAFAGLASVAAENTRLLEQTRRDAEAKSDLLRELNHRVKNNLTGIVALLEMNQPEMPEDVRLWLGRAINRIRAMAGAHQFFTGGSGQVTLDLLVSQILSTVAVSKPPNVAIETDLSGAHVELGAQQAVGLAMVLHELCYNAIVHGLRNGGTLTITARKGTDAQRGAGDQQSLPAAPPTCAIEVADNGPEPTGADARAAPPGSSGHGLELVEGLVRRELRGSFCLRRRPQGGTVAIVEFPCDGTEQ